MSEQSSTNNSNFMTQFGPTLKFAFLGFLILVLLIPLFMVTGLVEERRSRNEDVKAEIAANWGGAQWLIGPMVVVPITTGNNQKEFAVFLPESLHIDGKIEPEQRYRGIYKTTVYKSQLTLSGKLPVVTAESVKALKNVDSKHIDMKNAQILVAINDVKGIQNVVQLAIDGKQFDFSPAADIKGLSARLNGKTYANGQFKMALNLNGNEELAFASVGKTMTVHLSSPWPSPSFIGGYLPNSRKITASGFDADWKTTYFARPYPQQWVTSGLNQLVINPGYDEEGKYSGKIIRSSQNTGSVMGFENANSAFGVSLMTTVDLYQQVTRSTKYGILFIAFTFLTYFLFEVIAKIKLHVFQYTLVGVALCLFFCLLLALSEVVPFLLAYIVSSVGIVALITYYSLGFTQSKQQAWVMPCLLVALYGYLYVLLQLEDLSLLLGAIGLFIAMAILMGLTRKIDWFNRNNTSQST